MDEWMDERMGGWMDEWIMVGCLLDVAGLNIAGCLFYTCTCSLHHVTTHAWVRRVHGQCMEPSYVYNNHNHMANA